MLFESLHARAERTYARQHQSLGLAQDALVTAHNNLAPRLLERLFDRAQVADAVINNRQRHLGHLQNSLRAQHAPDARVLFDGTPERACSCFECAFEYVMRVSSAKTIYVKIAARGLCERAPEMFR